MRSRSLSESEREKIRNHIEECFRGAYAAHQERLERFQNYYRQFRGLRDMPGYGQDDEPTFRVPAIKWATYAVWSRITLSLIGPGAKIKCVPRGPSDHKLVRKIETYMKWRLFEFMRIAQPLSTVLFQAVLYGRSHAYVPWSTKAIGTGHDRVVYYDGPELIPLWPDEIVLPAGDYRDIHDAPWVIRRYYITPQELIEGENEGRYVGIRENWERILAASSESRDRENQPLLWAKDEAENVNPDTLSSHEGSLEAWEWYGNWRTSSSYSQEQLMVRYLPKLNLMIGMYDLERLFPRMANKRPFISFSMASDGSYWCPGIGELTTEIANEMTESDKMIARALQFSNGPVLFFRPTGGFDPEAFRYRPGVAYPIDDPTSVREISFRADIEQALIRQQILASYLERVTGISDQTLGRSIERPNAPRTLGGQQILLQQGGVRFAIDEFYVREGMKNLLRHVWQLDSQFCDQSVFFRVTEEEAGGLFEVKGGFASLSPIEREFLVDFDFEMSDQPSEKELKKAEALQLYQLDLSNPLIVQNPRALWRITKRLHEAFGDEEFSSVVPEPPDIGMPKTPKEEWNLALQGEDFTVHPMDHDEQHLAAHYADVQMEMASRQPDLDAIRRMSRHIAEQQSQLMQKRMMAGLATKVARGMAQTLDGAGGILAQPEIPVSLHGIMQAVQDLAGQAGQNTQTGGKNAMETE